MKIDLLFIFLQSGLQENKVMEESYFSLLMKGGWILLPIFLLFFLSVAVIIERWLVINAKGGNNELWMSRVIELIRDKKPEKAAVFCSNVKSSSGAVVSSGLGEIDNDIEEIQEAMQVEARQEINRMERGMNYLGITAAIAPMLGFLGTIFGVIKIFYNISVTNDLSIANISDGLYQKMICSGAGLFVGIIAYSGYYILNGRIDRVVSQMEKDSSIIVKCIRQFKKVDNEN